MVFLILFLLNDIIHLNPLPLLLLLFRSEQAKTGLIPEKILLRHDMFILCLQLQGFYVLEDVFLLLVKGFQGSFLAVQGDNRVSVGGEKVVEGIVVFDFEIMVSGFFPVVINEEFALEIGIIPFKKLQKLLKYLCQ